MITVLSGVLSLHLHENGAKLWSAEMLNILQAFPLIKILPLDSGERYSLTNNKTKI